jgi:MFS family permease
MTAATSTYFIAGNWIFFWTRFMTFGQLGLVDALAFAFGLLMEIPTGALSDLIGKKRTLIAAMIFNGSGFVFMASATEQLHLIIGFLIAQVGGAFYSGASEALAYDSLVERGQVTQFEQVITRSSVIALIMQVMTILIGAWLYHLEMRLPHYAAAAAYVIGLIAALALTEPKLYHEKPVFSPRVYLRQWLIGFQWLTRPPLLRILPLILALMGGFFLFAYGLIQPAIALSFGFDADAQAITQAILSITAAGVIATLPWMRRQISDYRILLILAVLLFLGFLGSALPLGYAGFAVLWVMYIAGGLSTPVISLIVNQAIESKDRATTLSTVSLMSKIPYVLSAIIAGQMIETGTFALFNVGVAAVILGLTGLSVLAWYRHRLDAPPLIKAAE